MNPRLSLTVLAVLCAAVVAGCGGPSKEEYASEANGICAQIQKDLQQVSQGGQTNDPKEINERTDQAVQAFTTGVNKINDLETPSGEAGEQAEQFSAAFEKFLKEDYQPGSRSSRRRCPAETASRSAPPPWSCATSTRRT